MRVTEGGLECSVPGESTEGIEETVFYNPRQELNRDLTVAALRAYREREPRAESYLDAMTASGIRGLRAAADGWEVTCCDADPEAAALARENLADHDARVIEGDANAVMHGEAPFDVVDLDPYGTPMPYADAAFASARDLVCVTATDTAPLCGAHLQSGIRSYSAVPRNTEYHAEVGVRILLSALARSAARFDVGVVPLVTYARSHYVRTVLELTHKPTAADAALSKLGHVAHCEECLYRETDRGLIADAPEECPNCGGERILVAGPVWLGPTHEREFLETVRGEISRTFGTTSKLDSLLSDLAGELEVPTHYDQHRLCKEWGLPANAMDDFLGDLHAAGFSASPAHYSGTAFKTDADVGEIRAATAPNLG